MGSADYSSAVKFEKSVRHDRPAATRSVITVGANSPAEGEGDYMVSQAYLRMPFKRQRFVSRMPAYQRNRKQRGGSGIFL